VSRAWAPSSTPADDRPPAAPLVADLDTLIALGPGRLDDDQVEAAVALRQHVQERLARGDALTVAALAGGTGVGKSALFNRLVGEELATEGVRRPTTGNPLAAVGQPGPESDALLDWLEVADRRTVAALPDGLVLLDLPDHDSVVEHNRRTAIRLTERVDALVVVTDPVKYARADLHDELLSRLLAHAEVTVVALNRLDELDPAGGEATLEDLRRRLRDDGFDSIEVVATSARTGDGVDELRRFLTDLADTRRAALGRLTGDAVLVAEAALVTLPPAREELPTVEQLLPSVLEATDGHRAAAEAETAYRRDARVGARSLLAKVGRSPFSVAVRWARDVTAGAPGTPPERRSAVTARVEAALANELDVATVAGRGHAALEQLVERTAVDATPALLDAVRSVPLRPTPPWWWAALAWLRGLAELTLLAGLAWLVAAGVVRWLQLPDLPLPQLTDELSWPAALLLFGLVARVLFGLLSRASIGLGGRQHRRRVTEVIRDGLADALRREVTRPFEEEAGRRQELHDALVRLARRTEPDVP
jgi:GTP-binding protein EngB required for normal cell division